MCESQAEGGRRCAAHTRPRLREAEAAYAANPNVANEDALDEALAEHASTNAGYNELTERLSSARMTLHGPSTHGRRRHLAVVGSSDDAPTAATELDLDPDRLERAIREGDRRRQIADTLASQLKWEPKARSASAVDRAEALAAQRRFIPNNLSDDTLNRLATDPDPGVRRAAANYHGILPAAAKRALAGSDDPEMRRALTKNQKIPDDIARELATDPDLDVRVELAKQHVLPHDVVATLQADASPRVRTALLWNQPPGSDGAVPSGRAREVVLNGLEDRSASVRIAALKAWRDARQGTWGRPPGDPGDDWAPPSPFTLSRLRNDSSVKVRNLVEHIFP